MGLIIDNFAGGGGASTGIEAAIGRSVDIAINHDPHAIAMHKTNHPSTLHYCESVFDIDPLQACGNRSVNLVWFSPDCCHFSKARGSTPVKKEIRGLAWVVLRWVLKKRPRVIMLENVEEFRTWGPLLDEIPQNPDLKPKELATFIGPILPSTGGYPDPARAGETFDAFVAMLSTGINIGHPAIDEAKETLNLTRKEIMQLVNGLGYQVDFRELRACDYGAPTIRKRLFMVMRRDHKPIVWPEITHGPADSEEVKSGKRRPFVGAASCIDWAIDCPSIFGRKKNLASNTLKRIVNGLIKFVMNNPSPYIVRIGQTGFGGAGMQYYIENPLTTVTSKAEHLIITPVIARQFGKSVGHDVTEPSGTITAGGGGKSQLIAPYLVKLRGTCQHGQLLTNPAPTVTAGGLHLAEARPFLIKYYGSERDGLKLTDPIHTVTSKDRFALANAKVEERPLTEELRLNAWYCARLVEQYSIPSHHPHLFPAPREQYVIIKGKYILVDLGMRMLQPRELYNAQGFPRWYVIDMDYKGNKYSKEKQVARCGNAVPPIFAEMLVRANLPDLCRSTQYIAA